MIVTSLDSRPYFAVRQAFDAPWPGPRGPEVILRSANLQATIYPEDGCRMTSLVGFGYELLRPWTPQRRAFQYGSFPMMPWVGRTENGILRFAGKDYQLPVNKAPHAMHGMACFGPWRIDEATADTLVCSFDLGDPWPWTGRATQRFHLHDDALDVAVTVATDGETFPAAAGWHPWFRKWLGNPGEAEIIVDGPAAEQLRVDFAADWQEEMGANEIPTGRRIAPRPGPWDDGFGFDGPMRARMTWPGRIGLDMSSPASSMVLYDKQPDTTCVEPLSAPPNGVNTRPHLVTPADPLVIATRWEIRSLAG